MAHPRALIALVLLAGGVPAGARTIVVRPPESIQGAVDRAAPGDTAVHIPRLELRLRVTNLEALPERLAEALDEALERAQVFFVGAPHSAYRKTSFRGKPVIDIWHATSEGISVL